MRHIEAKARKQEIVMYWAGAWLDSDPDWPSHRLSIPEYPNCWSVWRRRSVKRKALERAWRERRKNEVS